MPILLPLPPGGARRARHRRARIVRVRGDRERPHQSPQADGVLVHGAFADSSGFDGVIDRLRRDGYRVRAAPNRLLGLHSDAATVRGFLDSIKGPKVLVGHSYGGAVITQAASGDPDVKALVYVAAFALDSDELLSDLANRP